MEGKFLILKLSILSLILTTNLFAITVLFSKGSLRFEERVDKSKVEEKKVESISRNCTPLTMEDLEKNDYITTHHINTNVIICQKDVKAVEDMEIVFNFGGFTIIKKGRIVYENDSFIRFRNLDGTIEQIYKDGRLE